MQLPRSLARFNKLLTNRTLGRLGPLVPPFALVVHTGRRSGRAYKTPVWCFVRDDRVTFALTYGAEADWVRNLLAAGGGEMVRARRHFRLVEPRLLDRDEGLRQMPWLVRVVLKIAGLRTFLTATRAPA